MKLDEPNRSYSTWAPFRHLVELKPIPEEFHDLIFKEFQVLMYCIICMYVFFRADLKVAVASTMYKICAIKNEDFIETYDEASRLVPNSYAKYRLISFFPRKSSFVHMFTFTHLVLPQVAKISKIASRPNDKNDLQARWNCCSQKFWIAASGLVFTLVLFKSKFCNKHGSRLTWGFRYLSAALATKVNRFTPDREYLR